MQRLYNKFKPAGFRKFVDSNRSNRSSKSYSEAIKNKNVPPPPPPKDVIKPTVKDSVHNPNAEINNKLDQILSILSNMKKDMNDLDARIAKLEILQASSTITTQVIPTPIINKGKDPLIIPPAPQLSSRSQDTPNKRSRIAGSSSDDSTTSPILTPKPDLTNMVNEQAAIIAEQKRQMDRMFKQIEQFALNASQSQN